MLVIIPEVTYLQVDLLGRIAVAIVNRCCCWVEELDVRADHLRCLDMPVLGRSRLLAEFLDLDFSSPILSRLCLCCLSNGAYRVGPVEFRLLLSDVREALGFSRMLRLCLRLFEEL